MSSDVDKISKFSAYHIAKVLPAAYSDELSYYELLSKIQDYCNELADKINEIINHDESVVEELENIKAQIDEQVRKLYAHIDQFLQEFQDSSLDWDCQHGYFTNSVEAMRDMFYDVTVHSITVKQLNSLNMTCKDLSECGLNVRGLAVWGKFLFEPFDIDDEFKPNYSRATQLNVENIIGAQADSNGYVYVR